jgi:hypothetical protein
MTTLTTARLPVTSETSVDAVVEFSTQIRVDPSPYELSFFGNDDHVSALVSLDRMPASSTDVVEGKAEFVARDGALLQRWELRNRDTGSLLASAEIDGLGVAPLAPFTCRVRLFGSGVCTDRGL